MHRGLAYDNSANAIYSTNFHNGKLLKINAATGETIKNYGHPDYTPYGIAFDKYSNPSYASLWFLENSYYGEFRLARVDTASGHDNYILDLSDQLPDSSLSGGLEITNSAPQFPGKIIALAVDQHDDQVLFVDITDAEYLLPTELELTDEFAGWGVGIETRGMIAYLPYLYSIENGNLSLYDIETDPAHPAYVKTDSSIGHMTGGWGGNKIFKYGDKAFITVTGPYPSHKSTDFTTVESYSLSDPENPEYLNRVDVNLPIRDEAIFNNDIYLLHGLASNILSVVKWYSDGTLQLTHQYELFSDTGEPAYAADIAIDLTNHLMFLSYIYTSSSGYEHSGIWVYDISDADNLVKLYTTSTSGDTPMIMQILPNERLAVLLNHDTNPLKCQLLCYDYSDLTSLSFLNLISVSDTGIAYYMKSLRSNQLAVSLQNEGIKTFYWDETVQDFLIGPSIALEEPADIIHYLAPSNIPPMKGTINAPLTDNYESYMAVIRGYASSFDHIVHGSEKVGIIKAKQQPPAGKVNLTVNLNPSNATAHGCSVIPSAGVHQYNKGAGVNLYAKANEAEGWYFNKWTGDASGTNLITHITMDKDKNVTANFVEVLLTINGKKEAAVYCPNEIDKNPNVFSLPIIVTASDADDWELEKISLKTRGSGDELQDIDKVEIFLGNSIRYSGNFSVDNGQISATFNPPISIGAGESVTLNLIYTFKFNSHNYAFDTTKSFYLETFAAVAKPVHYDAGKIAGKAVHDSLTFARIKNFYDIPFTTIKEAVKSKYTEDGDTCYVCAGTYEGNLFIGTFDKSVTIKSIEGKEKTIIKPTSNISPAVYLYSDGDGCLSFIGFTVDGSSFPVEPEYDGIFNLNSNGGKILDNTIKGFFNGIVASGTNREIANNLIEDCNVGGHFECCNDSKISNNIFQNNSDKYDMIIYHCENTEISGNKSFNTKFNNSLRINGEYVKYLNINNNTILDLTLEDVDSSTIKYNTAAQRIEMKRADGCFIKYNSVENNPDYEIDAITVTKKEKGGYNYIIDNTIKNNKGFGISCNGKVLIKYNYIYRNGTWGFGGIMLSDGPGTVASNHIYQNCLYGIALYHTKNILITNNYISGHAPGSDYGAGIFITGSYKNKIWDNVIKKNDTGIKLDSSFNNSIYNNTISDNTSTSTGIHINNSSPDILGNNITNNNGNGIFCENSAKPTISSNNIIGNGLFGLNNSDAGLNINANSNFWGSSSGPGQQDITGNVTANQWLSKQVSIVANPQIDSAFVLINSSDSVALYIQNLKTYNDIIKITVSDDKGWMTPLTEHSLTLSDSTGTEFYLKYIIPNNAQTQEVSTVSYSVYSTSDSNTASGTFYLKTYAQVLNSLYIFTDSLTVMYGDSVRFFGVGFDQHEYPVQINPNWSATHGIISNTGMFFSDSTTGEGMITLSDQTSGMKAYAHFYNSDQAEVLNKITIEPDSVVLKSLNGYLFTVKGYNQFNYPKNFVQVWNSSEGTINKNGFFTPDSVNKKYIITVSDTSETLSDTAIVIIEEPEGVEKIELPSEFSLSQNYPNPFNPTTTIKYTLKTASQVRLEVFNILGQRVMLPVNKVMQAGAYEAVLNLSAFASGVYFYRLIAVDQKSGSRNNFVSVKKMILLK